MVTNFWVLTRKYSLKSAKISCVKIMAAPRSWKCWKDLLNSFDGGPYHIETSSLICWANQWTCFYMIETSVKKVTSVTFLLHMKSFIFYIYLYIFLRSPVPLFFVVVNLFGYFLWKREDFVFWSFYGSFREAAVRRCSSK